MYYYYVVFMRQFYVIVVLVWGVRFNKRRCMDILVPFSSRAYYVFLRKYQFRRCCIGEEEYLRKLILNTYVPPAWRTQNTSLK